MKDRRFQKEDSKEIAGRKKIGLKGRKKKGRSPIKSKALWTRIINNLYCGTGPLAHPFARSLAPLTRGKVNDSIAIFSVFFLF